MIRFGAFEFDRDAFRLRRDGVSLAVEPKALALLDLLIARAPRLVEKSEIFSVVWKDVAVTDNALTRVVAQLRKTLDDDPRSPRFIETVATRGYRWIATSESLVTPPLTANVELPPPAPAGRRPWLSMAIGAVLVATAIAFTYRSAPGSATDRLPAAGSDGFPDATTLAALRPTQMTSGRGYDGYLSFAPDGRSFAFSSDRTGALEIYVQGSAPGSAVAALTTNGHQNIQPEWSPDGQFIAFHDMADDGIWIVPSRGGVARKVSDYGSNPAWSPDGRQLVFQELPATQVNTLGIPGVLGTIAVVNASGERPPVRITRPGSPPGPHTNPTWLNDGRIVFAAGKEGDDSISLWAVDAAGGEARIFAVHEGMNFDYALSPDDRRLFFIPRGGNAIWTMRVTAEGGAEARPTGLQTAGAFIGGLTLSGDGRRIGWTSMEITGHVWARTEGGSATLPLIALTAGRGVRYTNPTPSTDGRLLMTGNRPGGAFSLYMLDGVGEPRPLTPHPPGHGGTQWLPGQREVVALTDHGEGPSVYALDPSTGRERRLFGTHDIPWPLGETQASSAAPAINIVFSSRFDRAVLAIVKDGRSNLWMIGLRDMKPDGSIVQKTFEVDGASYPAWSPDDKWIAYQCGEATNMHVCVIDAVTGVRTRLTHEPGQSWVGGWGADNETIFYAARRAAIWNIASVSRSTGTVRQLTTFTEATSYVRYPKWDEKNRRVLFERSEAVGRTWSATLAEP